MNMLNSIVIEGKAGDVALQRKLFADGKTDRFGFWIESESEARLKDGTVKKTVSTFLVRTYGTLADVCSQNVERGRVVRVVGALRREEGESPETYILAEHIEFKPDYGKEENDA